MKKPAAKTPVVSVTDHAVIRYLERVRGVDIETVRREIAAKVRLVLAHPTATGILSDGFRYVLINGKVITVHDVNMTPKSSVGTDQAGDDDQ